MIKIATIVQLLVLATLMLCTFSCGDDSCEATNANFVEMTVDGQPFVPTTVKATRTISGMEIKLKNDELEINIRTRKPAGTFNLVTPQVNDPLEAWVESIDQDGNYQLADSGTVNVFGCDTQSNGSFDFNFQNVKVNGHFEGFSIEGLSSIGCLITELSQETIKCGENLFPCSIRNFITYEYNSEGRIVAIFYKENKLRHLYKPLSGEDYTYVNGKIVVDNLHYNEDGQITSYKDFRTDKNGPFVNNDHFLELVNGNYTAINIVKFGTADTLHILKYQYDNMKSYGILLQSTFYDQPVLVMGALTLINPYEYPIINMSKNNPLQLVHVNEFQFSYTYNKSDYPTSILKTHNGDTIQTVSIKYVNCE